MTNFEKWKQDLTFSKFLKYFIADACPGKTCPAFKICKNTKGCRDAFKTWANQEADIIKSTNK